MYAPPALHEKSMAALVRINLPLVQ